MDFFLNYHDLHLKVIDSLKMALYKRDSSIFEKLDFENDDIFSEPFLFSCLNNNNQMWLETVITCLRSSNKNKKSITNFNTIGLTYLPSLGYLSPKDDCPKDAELIGGKEFMNLIFKDKSYDFELLPIIKNSEGIEFLVTNHPLIAPLFIDEDGKLTEVDINKEIYSKHIPSFNNALEVIKKNYRQYYNLISKYIKKIVFYSGNANSFATIQAHGMAFFRVEDCYNEIFFLDNIMHQCAHVFFNTLTFDKKSLFTIPYNSKLSSFTEEIQDEKYVLYDRFHGLFTQSNINICMERCIDTGVFSGDKHIELIGRFTSNMKRFAIAIRKFNQKEKYLKEGKKWHTFFERTYYDIYGRKKELIEKYDVSNQPYVFDLEIFKQTNIEMLE